MMRKDIKAILEKLENDTLSPQEEDIARLWLFQLNDDKVLNYTEEELDAVTDKIWAGIETFKPQHKITRLWPRIAAAASILLVIGCAVYFLLSDHKIVADNLNAEQIQPFDNGVVLTEGNGSKIILKREVVGRVATADGSRVRQLDSSLNYVAAVSPDNDITHTLANNTGIKYQLTLADGTEVYLDALSTITFPVAFKRHNREVSITGQVYFKVKHDALHPFSVKVKDQVIEDIGTEFNIDAFNGIKTTLVSGAVTVNRQKQHVNLKPGQAAVGDELAIVDTDLEETTAWLQDKVMLNRASLEQVMAEISKSYNVKVIWLDPNLRKHRFFGSFSRKRSLANILNYLKKIDTIDFKVEDHTVIVSNKQ